MDHTCRRTGARDTSRDGVATAGWAHAFAIVVRVRSPGARPDGRRGCKTCGMGCAGCVRRILHSPGARSKKICRRLLGADPRGPVTEACWRIPVLQGPLAELRRPGDVRRSDIDTAGFEPGASSVPSESDDSAGCRVSAAIAEQRLGTPDCNSGLGGGWGERASHIP